MKCSCGNASFYAVQRIEKYETVLVDGDGDFAKVVPDDGNHFHHPDANSCVDCDRAEGPFFCTACGKEYEEIG